jgi:AbrB family transcriptional regulator (stage V sporulation protein T)
LEIFTDREGEVIFKKYSPIGEMAQFAAQYAETLHKTCGMSVAICDRDVIIACAGVPKKELMDRKLSREAEEVVETRQLFVGDRGNPLPITDGSPYSVSCLMPIITEGDITGCVVSLMTGDGKSSLTKDIETKLIQTAAGFLGKQLDS